MPYDTLFVFLVIYVCATPLFYAKAVKFGMKLVDKPEEAECEPVFNLPKRKEKPKMTPEEARMVQKLENIDRYDGSPEGQKEIV